MTTTTTPTTPSGQNLFRITLGNLETAENLSIIEDKLAPSKIAQNILAKDDLSSAHQLERKFMEFCIQNKQWMNPEDLISIEKISRKFFGAQETESRSFELRNLVDMLSKEILQKEQIPLESYLALYNRRENQSSLKQDSNHEELKDNTSEGGETAPDSENPDFSSGPFQENPENEVSISLEQKSRQEDEIIESEEDVKPEDDFLLQKNSNASFSVKTLGMCVVGVIALGIFTYAMRNDFQPKPEPTPPGAPVPPPAPPVPTNRTLIFDPMTMMPNPMYYPNFSQPICSWVPKKSGKILSQTEKPCEKPFNISFNSDKEKTYEKLPEKYQLPERKIPERRAEKSSEKLIQIDQKIKNILEITSGSEFLIPNPANSNTNLENHKIIYIPAETYENSSYNGVCETNITHKETLVHKDINEVQSGDKDFGEKLNNEPEYTDDLSEPIVEKTEDDLKAGALAGNIKPMVGIAVGVAFSILSALVLTRELFKKCCCKKKNEGDGEGEGDFGSHYSTLDSAAIEGLSHDDESDSLSGHDGDNRNQVITVKEKVVPRGSPNGDRPGSSSSSDEEPIVPSQNQQRKTEQPQPRVEPTKKTFNTISSSSSQDDFDRQEDLREASDKKTEKKNAGNSGSASDEELHSGSKQNSSSSSSSSEEDTNKSVGKEKKRENVIADVPDESKKGANKVKEPRKETPGKERTRAAYKAKKVEQELKRQEREDAKIQKELAASQQKKIQKEKRNLERQKAEAARQAEEQKRAAEVKAKQEAEEKVRLENQAKIQATAAKIAEQGRKAAEKAKVEADNKAKMEAEKARVAEEEKKAVEEKARLEAEQKAKVEAENQAKREAQNDNPSALRPEPATMTEASAGLPARVEEKNSPAKNQPETGADIIARLKLEQEACRAVIENSRKQGNPIIKAELDASWTPEDDAKLEELERDTLELEKLAKAVKEAEQKSKAEAEVMELGTNENARVEAETRARLVSEERTRLELEAKEAENTRQAEIERKAAEEAKKEADFKAMLQQQAMNRLATEKAKGEGVNPGEMRGVQNYTTTTPPRPLQGAYSGKGKSLMMKKLNLEENNFSLKFELDSLMTTLKDLEKASIQHEENQKALETIGKISIKVLSKLGSPVSNECVLNRSSNYGKKVMTLEERLEIFEACGSIYNHCMPKLQIQTIGTQGNFLTGNLELKQVDGIDKILCVKWAIILWLSTSEKSNAKNTLRELFAGIKFVNKLEMDTISNLFSEFELQILNDTFKMTACGMNLDKCLNFKQSQKAKFQTAFPEPESPLESQQPKDNGVESGEPPIDKIFRLSQQEEK